MKQQTLRRVLWADAVASGASGVLTIAGVGLIGGWLDVSPWVPFIVGVAMIPWVLFLVRTVWRDQLRPTELGAIIAINVGWAVATAAHLLILGFPDAVSIFGWLVIGHFAFGGLGFGITAGIGLRGLSSSTVEPAFAEAAGTIV